MIQRITSAGGIEAWLVEDYAVPLVAVDFAFKGGTAQDRPDKSGATHLMASMLDEGAGERDDVAFQEAIEDHAVELSFTASRDAVSGSLRTLVEKRDIAFSLLKDALNHPRFDEAATDRVRESWLSALRRENKTPNAMASRALFGAAFPDHPYRHDPRGTIGTLAAVTRLDLKDRHAALLARDVLVVSVVGAINADDTRRMLDEVFGPLPAKSNLVPIEKIRPAAIGETIQIDLDTPQTVIQFATHGISRSDPDFMPAFVVNHVFGGGSFTSRLFQEVREKRGLAYSVSSQLVAFNHAALLVGGCATKNERAAESVEIIGREIRDLATKGATPDELAKAKLFLTGSYALRFDTSSKIAGQFTQLQLDGYGPEYIDERNNLVNAVTDEDMKRAAARLFGNGEMLVVAVGRPVGL